LLQTGSPVHFDSDSEFPGTKFNTRSGNSSNAAQVRWVTSWNFTIPTSQLLWKLEATLGFELLTGGALGLLLDTSRQGLPDFSCLRSGACVIALHTQPNQNILQAALTAGTYTLWLFERIGEKNTDLSPCSPFSLKLDIDSEQFVENFLTCDASVIPSQLQTSIFEDPPGYIYFQESALLDLESGGHDLSIQVSSPSFIRVYSAPHRVDIDLRLKNQMQTVAYSYAWGGEEGLVAFLPPGGYNLSLIYFGSYPDKFCETFDLEIALADIPFTLISISVMMDRMFEVRLLISPLSLLSSRLRRILVFLQIRVSILIMVGILANKLYLRKTLKLQLCQTSELIWGTTF